MRKHSFKHGNSNGKNNNRNQGGGGGGYNANVVSAPDFFKEDEIPQKM